MLEPALRDMSESRRFVDLVVLKPLVLHRDPVRALSYRGARPPPHDGERGEGEDIAREVRERRALHMEREKGRANM